jgi:hypothetical protein
MTTLIHGGLCWLIFSEIIVLWLIGMPRIYLPSPTTLSAKIPAEHSTMASIVNSNGMARPFVASSAHSNAEHSKAVRASLKRSHLAQAAIDVSAALFAFLFVAVFATAVLVSVFILIFVKL